MSAAGHDAGGSKRWPLQPGVKGGALFTACGRGRTALVREWGPSDGAVFVTAGLNPSTAGADIDDPTIRRGMEFARREGFWRYCMMNACAYCSTDPAAIDWAAACEMQAENLNALRRLLSGRASIRFVGAWGAAPRRFRPFIDSMLSVVRGEFSRTVWCLGQTQSGAPRHPLYVKGSAPLQVWPTTLEAMANG